MRVSFTYKGAKHVIVVSVLIFLTPTFLGSVPLGTQCTLLDKKSSINFPVLGQIYNFYSINMKCDYSKMYFVTKNASHLFANGQIKPKVVWECRRSSPKNKGTKSKKANKTNSFVCFLVRQSAFGFI